MNVLFWLGIALVTLVLTSAVFAMSSFENMGSLMSVEQKVKKIPPLVYLNAFDACKKELKGAEF